MTSTKRLAREWIVAGFALAAAGAVVNAIVLMHSGYLAEGNVRADLQLFAGPVGAFAGFWAWRLLSQLAALEERHGALFRGAFIGLAVQSLCLGVSYANFLWLSPRLGQYTIAPWIYLVANAVTFVGFVLMSREFRSGPIGETAE